MINETLWIDYGQAERFFFNDSKQAVGFILEQLNKISEEEMFSEGFVWGGKECTVVAPALNPTIRALEAVGQSECVVVIPSLVGSNTKSYILKPYCYNTECPVKLAIKVEEVGYESEEKKGEIMKEKEFLSVVGEYEERSVMDDTPSGVYTDGESIMIWKQKEKKADFGLFVTIKFNRDGVLDVCNGVDASGHDYEVPVSSVGELKEIINQLYNSDAMEPFDWAQGYLSGKGKWMGCF